MHGNNNIQVLLNDISEIEKKHSKNVKPEDNFNIFEIYNMRDDELSHSKFLYTLLNPKGCHGKGTLFIEKFLSVIGIKDFPLTNVKVEKEYYVGKIDKNYDSGGRLDIIISNRKSGKNIVIENKTNTGEGYKQLHRYKNSVKNSHIVYLTPFGTEASDNSFEYIRMSYKKDIINWLDECIKISTDNSIIKETLKQYKKLVEKMTFQTRSIQMANDVIKLITRDEDNLKSAFEIANNMDEAKKSLIEEYFKPKLMKISEKFNMTLDFSEKDIGEKGWGWSMYKKDWTSLAIGFAFECEDFDGLFFGFPAEDFRQRKLSKRLTDYLRKLGRHTPAWPLWISFDVDYEYWDAEIFFSFKEKNSYVLTLIEDKINELLKLVKDRKDL
jgi:hypothetical protein